MKFVNFENISDDERDWLNGLFLADGSKCKEKRTYRTYFYLNPKDTKILTKLQCILTKLGVRYNAPIKKGAIAVNTSCKSFFCSMPDKRGPPILPKNIDAFIAGFLDGDGYIQRKWGYVGFSQTTVKWIGPFISNYLLSKNIVPWRNKVYRNCFYYRASAKKIRENTRILEHMSIA